MYWIFLWLYMSSVNWFFLCCLKSTLYFYLKRLHISLYMFLRKNVWFPKNCRAAYKLSCFKYCYSIWQETQVAITRKAKEQVKMLLVYLHGNKDTESRDFISKILSNDEVIGQMNSNFILWGCSVATPEGNGVMRKFRASKVPFTIIMCPKDNKMVVVAKIKNVLDAQVSTKFLNILVTVNWVVLKIFIFLIYTS